MSNYIGAGYGSEYHLMRYMARYRNELDSEIKTLIGTTCLNWLDFKHKNKNVYSTSEPTKVSLPDRELEGLEFVAKSEDPRLHKEWGSFWPQKGTQQNWDAVAKITIDKSDGWLLVEAKANTGEIKKCCNATASASIKKIDCAFQKTKDFLTITASENWKKNYYQYANRLAALCFLRNHGIMAKLLFIYFFGDKHQQLRDGSICPQTAQEWYPFLEEQKQYLGITDAIKQHFGIHELLLNVAPE